MKYDFTTVLDRHGRDSLAFDKIPFAGVQPDEGFDTIPTVSYTHLIRCACESEGVACSLSMVSRSKPCSLGVSAAI